MNKTRVYLFTGFLESGKSSFIQDTLLEQGFGEDEKTLIIACEEGEVAFDIPGLEKENASVEFIENEEDLNYETLLHLHQKYQPTQVAGGIRCCTIWCHCAPLRWGFWLRKKCGSTFR